MNWRDVESSAPELARLGKDRLDQTRVALLATLRKDGSPRISPVEPLEQATFISWDTEHGKMIVRRWSPPRGYTESTRNYP